MTLRELASWYEARLMRDKREDGSEFWKFECDDPAEDERCRALAFAAHGDGDMLPDDWRYAFIQEALTALSEADDPDDVDLEADIYTADLTRWLGSRASRYQWCDEAQEEGLLGEGASMVDRMQVGQYLEKREVLSLVRAHLESELEDQEDDE